MHNVPVGTAPRIWLRTQVVQEQLRPSSITLSWSRRPTAYIDDAVDKRHDRREWSSKGHIVVGDASSARLLSNAPNFSSMEQSPKSD